MGIVIDTSALVAVERRATDLSAVLSIHGEEPVALPAIVWAELLAGVRLAKDTAIAARRRAFLEQIRLNIALVPFDDLVAEHYADIFAECLKTGTPIPQNDIAVAATARHLGYSVLVGSQDENHFRNVKGLNVIVLAG
jgi:predicted nucleic acid-binding protein